MKKERPILFSTPMIQALLAGRKTQTRRITGLDPINQNPDQWEIYRSNSGDTGFGWNYPKPNDYALVFRNTKSGEKTIIKVPYGEPEDILWVRESFVTGAVYEDECLLYDEAGDAITRTWYKATSPDLSWFDCGDSVENVPWKPSIHMPKAAARIYLEITDIRAERVQDIREEDAKAEGAKMSEFPFDYYSVSFMALWQKINGPESWEANPWAWAVSFTLLSTTGRPDNK